MIFLHDIVPIIGNVNFQITLDPSVWIFDDRKIEREEFLNAEDKSVHDFLAEREADQTGIREGVVRPPINRSIKRFEREKILTESYFMPLIPFLTTSEPKDDAKGVRLEQTNGESVDLTIDQAKNGLLYFAENGKPLKESGPVHFYFGDKSNKDNPITDVHKIIVL